MYSSLLGALAQLHTAIINYVMSVRPSFPLDEFSGNLIVEFFSPKNLSRKFNFHQNLTIIAVLYMINYAHF